MIITRARDPRLSRNLPRARFCKSAPPDRSIVDNDYTQRRVRVCGTLSYCRAVYGCGGRCTNAVFAIVRLFGKFRGGFFAVVDMVGGVFGNGLFTL